MGQEASLPVSPESAAADLSHNGAGSRRPAVKALGNIMKRGNDGVEYNDKESARAAAMGGHFAMSDDSASSQTNQQHQYSAAPVQMTPEQQQAYHMAQQQQMMQQQQQQHGYAIAQSGMTPQEQQAFYMAQQHANGNGIIPPPPVDSPPPDAAVTIMGTAEATGGKGGRGGKMRGTRLINSMKNLAINAKTTAGAVVHGDHNHEASAAATTSGDSKIKAADSVSDWQRQWEEDESDDEEEDAKLPASPLRPGMDDGYSQAAVGVPSADPRIMPTAPKTPERSAESATMPVSPLKDGVIRASPARQKQHVERQLSDGVEWDTGAQVMPRKEKPSIEMFLPMLRVLGKGSFGKVVLVQKNCGGDVGQLFAMKILKKEYLKKRRQVERTQTERKVLQAVNHPFIMKMHYAFQSEDKLFFVLDYCAGGELFFHLSRFRRFPERVARFYTSELLLAIGHLHKRGIIYRDLKPENVLIDADGHVKLGDFGLAKTGITHPCEGALSMCGTPEYMAPEVLLQQGHGFCVDYWGIGMLVYEMMTGLPPWYTTDRAKLFRRLKSAPLEIPSFFSEQCANCVSAFLERSPRRRLGYRGLKSAMEHPFFRPINFRALYARRVDPPIRPCDGWTEQDALAAINSPTGGENETRDALDRATANFDQTFTTMPVDQEDDSHDDYDDGESYGTHDDNYVGFTYDDEDFSSPNVGPSRQRTKHGGYHESKE